jgi:hypothetical protein
MKPKLISVVKFASLVIFAALAWKLIIPEWGAAKHATLDSSLAKIIAFREAKHYGAEDDEGNTMCLVSREESENHKLYIFEMRGKKRFSVYVSSTPNSTGLETGKIASSEKWSNPVADCNNSLPANYQHGN